VVLLGLALRAWSAWQLPIDADEPVYLRAGYDYAQLIRAGNLQGVIDYPNVQEHPALVKLLYGIPFVASGLPEDEPGPFIMDRLISVLFGTLAVLALALVDPLAGFLLAAHSMAIKYTAEVYLEAVPMALSLMAVLAFERAARGDGEQRVKGTGRWLWASALALGAAGAGKYPYLVVVPVIGFIAVYYAKHHHSVNVKRLTIYVALAVAAFLVFDVHLWRDPLIRLRDSLFFHPAYTHSLDVLAAGYPWYQPLVWISNSVQWHPQVFFFPTADELVFYLALPGLYLALRRQPWAPVWVLIAFVTLLLWPTKWPQYSLIMTAPLCLLAAATARWLYAKVKTENPYWDTIKTIIPRPSRAAFVLLGLFLLTLVAGRVVYELQMAQARAGWTQVTTDTSPLPSNTINAIVRSRDGRMVIATDAGVAFWKPAATAPWGNTGDAPVYTPGNAGLPSARVLTALQAADGSWWFGTDQGVAHLSDERWTVYHAGDMKLSGERVRALHQDATGRMWVGTLAGVAAYDGHTWASFTKASGLLDDTIFSIASQGDTMWFGSLDGISRLDMRDMTWRTFALSEGVLGWHGVTDLHASSGGQLWAATQGGGLARWDGKAWQFDRTDNSGIPSNTVDRLFEAAPGVLWVGFGYAAEPGGFLARFDADAKTWQRFTSENSGYGGHEPTALAVDHTGRLWIGASNGGLQLYDHP
jgi:hypothetical protein